MSIEDTITLTRLLARLSSPSQTTLAGVQELASLGTKDASFDLYEPRGRRRGAVVAIHGVTAVGGRDSRLVHFARSLAAVGVACAVPTLPRLAACQWHPEDVDALGDVVDALQARTARRPGLVGFSHGASYGLVLASRDTHAERVRFVLAFGPYHHLDRLLQEYAQRQPPAAGDAAALDDWIYLHLVLARRLGPPSGLSPEVARELDQLLARYCHDTPLDEKQAFFQQHLAQRGLIELALQHRNVEELDAVSPSGKLGRVRCPVSVIHDARDTMVPPEHSRRVYEELVTRGDGTKQTLLITRLLSHVTMRDTLRLGEAASLLRALRPVVLEELG